MPKARTKIDQKLGNVSKEGEAVKINEIKVVYDEEIDHKSKKICVNLPLSNEKLIDLQEKDTQVSKICEQLFTAHSRNTWKTMDKHSTSTSYQWP